MLSGQTIPDSIEFAFRENVFSNKVLGTVIRPVRHNAVGFGCADSRQAGQLIFRGMINVQGLVATPPFANAGRYCFGIAL